LDEEHLKLERRQKELMTKANLPHFPVHELWDYPTPPRVYNPWDDFVPPQGDDDIELDYASQEIPGGDDEEGGVVMKRPSPMEMAMVAMMSSSLFWR